MSTKAPVDEILELVPIITGRNDSANEIVCLIEP